MKFSDLLEATLILLLGLLLVYIVVKSDYFTVADIVLGVYVVALLIEFRHKLASLCSKNYDSMISYLLCG